MPSLESSGNSKFPTLIPASNYEHSSVAYIDLDLPPPSSDLSDPFSPKALANSQRSRGSVNGGRISGESNSGTAYKKIDFVRTEAFNRTRHIVEEKYNKDQEQS